MLAPMVVCGKHFGSLVSVGRHVSSYYSRLGTIELEGRKGKRTNNVTLYWFFKKINKYQFWPHDISGIWWWFKDAISERAKGIAIVLGPHSLKPELRQVKPAIIWYV